MITPIDDLILTLGEGYVIEDGHGRYQRRDYSITNTILITWIEDQEFDYNFV